MTVSITTTITDLQSLDLQSLDFEKSHTTVSISEPNLEKSMKSYLLCNKVRVYTSIPDKMLPMGTVMLPIGEDKWTVASLG